MHHLVLVFSRCCEGEVSLVERSQQSGKIQKINSPTGNADAIGLILAPKSGWWQLKYFFIFTPKIGEDEPILTHIFQLG